MRDIVVVFGTNRKPPTSILTIGSMDSLGA